jgi:ABC-type polysaccharide/polyol phosphate export permease
VGTTSVAVRDLGGSLARLPLAARLALDDIHGKYRRTILGPLWLAIGQAATIGGFLVVFSGLLGSNDPVNYALYLSAGIPVWALIAQYLSDMPQTFIAARGLIESYELPWLTHIWRRSIGYVLTFLHHIVTFFAVIAILAVLGRLQNLPSPNMLLAVPALAILLVAGTGLGMLFAVLGARYRDLQPAMQVASGFLFLFTPVMWRSNQLHEQLAWTYQYNPLYYYITLVREPLLGRAPGPEIWIGAGVGAVIIFGLGFVAFLLGRRRLYHWL